jgi:hypothetical protein
MGGLIFRTISSDSGVISSIVRGFHNKHALGNARIDPWYFSSRVWGGVWGRTEGGA